MTFGSALSGIAGLVGLLHLFGADRERRLGTFANVQLVQFDDAVRVKLNCPSPHRFQADGEFAGKLTEVELESVSRALTVFAPADARPPHERSIGEVLRDLIRIR